MTERSLWRWQFGSADAASFPAAEKTHIAFADLPGWHVDNLAAAFTAFRKSFHHLQTSSAGARSQLAALAFPGDLSADDARAFLEKNFTAHLISRPTEGAMVTGYFEPELAGSLEQDQQFQVPVYGLPGDLHLLAGEPDRGNLPDYLTAARMTDNGLVAYYTREEIEKGALAGLGLEIAYLTDPYDAYIMQVQGSGLIRLPDGRGLRIGFSGKNGHPYTSVGKLLIERGAVAADKAGMDAVFGWLREHPDEGRALMWRNKSYPFFRKLGEDEAENGPHGAMGVPLTPGRSLAVDPRHHQLGLPIWVRAPDLKDENGLSFNRLMIAQDTGSAIRGPVRGDIFWGTGADAGHLAGSTKDICDFYILIPN